MARKAKTKKMEVDVTPTEIKPTSDMWAIYNLVGERLIDEGLFVNSDTLPSIEIQNNFVDDCMAMIPQGVGQPPEYPPFNFTARISCVVAKGYETGTRLEILKDAVRAAFMRGPFTFGLLTVTPTIVGEKDTKEIGVRKSELTIIMKVEKINKKR